MGGAVYKLVCPIKNEPIYVGSTIFVLEQRLAGHKTNIKKSDLPLYLYCRQNNIVPTIELLEDVIDNDLSFAEKKWMDRLTADGFTLLNAKKIKNTNTGSIKILPEVYGELSTFCKQNGFLVSKFATEAVKEKLQKEKK